MNTESIIYLARKLGWTRKEIGQLTQTQFTEVINEIIYQESVEQYNRNYQVASILAAIYNTIPTKSKKVFKPSDFLKGDEPERNKRQNTLEELATKHNINLPTKELKNRG